MSPTDNDSARDVFAAIIPAPNPTGQLHMGHALNLTVQDVLCRWNALKGARICWAGALDHGATATEYVAEKMLRERGIDTTDWTKGDLGAAIAAWVEHITPQIHRQLARMNLILDLEEPRSMGDALRQQQFEALIEELRQSGLLYRGKAVVAWCRRKKTSVDKADVFSQVSTGEEYCVRYLPGTQGASPIDLWIEAPETLTNDEALVISSKHPLASSCDHKIVVSPLGRLIPVIVDDSFPLELPASSVARATPGHCAKSFRWARRQGRPINRSYDETNVMEGGDYAGLAREEAARRILARLEAEGRLVARRRRETSREIFRLSGGPVEELLTEQCFLETAPMARQALRLLRDGTVRVYPEMYREVLEAHLEQIVAAKAASTNHELSDDWCISHQTAWGTKFSTAGIPYRALPGQEGIAPPPAVEQIANMRLSCALWVFCANRVYASDRGEFRRLSENSICVTGVDLLFFWIAPILFLATCLETGSPFRDVIIHPVVCDAKGQKMSKSLGNVISPNEIIEAHGSDALRFGLLSSLNLAKQKLFLDEKKIEAAKRRLDEVGRAGRSLKEKLGAAAAAPAPRIEPIFGEIDRALAVCDFATAMDCVVRLMDRVIAAAGADRAEQQQVLPLVSLLEPFAPALVRDL